jgi:hypothetical protein
MEVNMNKSETIAQLAVALVKAQAEMPTVLFDAKNPFLKYKYATLGAVISASKPVLAKYGLAVTQFPISQEGRIGVTSILVHESGEWLEHTISLVPEVGKGMTLSQAAGVIITYLRRYSWAAILGMYADEDGDGENAAVDAEVKKIMEDKTNEGVDPKTGEIAHTRTWSFEQMDGLLEHAAGIASDYEEAKAILDLSVLPDSVTPKAVESWFKHFLKAEGTNLDRAGKANEAYIKAKKGGK